MFQIVFNPISAAELSKLDTLKQMDLLDSFQVNEKDLEDIDGIRFGKIERDGKVLYRFRAQDYRVYFEVQKAAVVVHRILHKGTVSDFLYRSTKMELPENEDLDLAQSKHFWKLIDEGKNASQKSSSI